MTQGISIYSAGELLYHTVHERNGDYLERENQPEKFKILKDIDDCDPSSFGEAEVLQSLILDLDLVIIEAQQKQDAELANHLKEILVLCRLCIWNLGKFTLIISPFEYVPDNKAPSELPEKYFKNISRAGLTGFV
jgi:hypothetical protein